MSSDRAAATRLLQRASRALEGIPTRSMSMSHSRKPSRYDGGTSSKSPKAPIQSIPGPSIPRNSHNRGVSLDAKAESSTWLKKWKLPFIFRRRRAQSVSEPSREPQGGELAGTRGEASPAGPSTSSAPYRPPVKTAEDPAPPRLTRKKRVSTLRPQPIRVDSSRADEYSHERSRRQRPSPAPVLPPEFDGVPTSVVMAVLPDLLRQYRQDEESAFNTYHPGLTRQDSGVTIATMATVGVDTDYDAESVLDSPRYAQSLSYVTIDEY
ncbi:hypothetical protein NLI96_g4834 [Meripilus lineatus]|uniref:Uncharacterized protein n=1 Tax=Meripilus lineatus TaxID=2056292 RepID=A0AAD5V4G9_9APHY|nr:hypothetical protein NLI96_g4834 [Physisporinus lineatus]